MKRSKFSLSNTKLLSCDMGQLIPCGLVEVLPGDTIQMSTNALVRAAPLLSPVMHPVQVRIHHWFVPHRLVWTAWEDFITGGPTGTDASVFPTIATAGPAVGSLSDYLGLATGAAGTNSALPYRGYQLIWNEWYRDQDLETAAGISKASGADGTTSATLKNCSWEKDYFTSSRPWEQKGPAVTVPLLGTAPVELVPFGTSSNAMLARRAADDTIFNTSNPVATTASGEIKWAVDTGVIDPNSRLRANLAGVSAVSVNMLRQALALQRFEEMRARFGSRYVEYLRSLGVRSSDARLDKPEYLGGGKNTIQFSEVLQQGVTTSGNTLGVGNLRGHGITGIRSNRFRRFFEEHGYIFSLMSVRPKTIYANGIPRTWNRRTKEDFWQRELQHIGQQAVKNKEVYGAHATPDGTFGYQDRYDEYRRTESTIAGEFRSTLSHWHMARIFTSDPALNASFVTCVPTERTFAVPSEHVIYAMCNHSVQARRLVASVGSSFTF